MNNSTLGAKFMLFVFAFTVLASAGINAQVHNKDYYYERARWRSATGDNAGALDDLNLALTLAPDDPHLYNTRGIVYEKRGDYTAARADYEHALRLNPDSAEAKHNINNLNEKLSGMNLVNAGTVPTGYTQPAPAQQTTYVPARPVQQQRYTPVRSPQQEVAAQVRVAQQQSYAPAQSAQQATYPPARPVQQVTYGSLPPATHTENINFLNTSAVSYSRSGMNIGLFRQTGTPVVNDYGNVLQPAALRTDAGVYGQTPYRAPAHKTFVDAAAENNNNYGIMLNSSGRFEEAVVKFTEAIEIYPEYAIAYNNRGVAYASTGDFVRATEDFIKALRINPYYYDAQVNYKRINGNVSVAAVTE
ncbi:MAG: tetratricopeptide repeat protein [Spirochaetaceae bacterium]|jgi:Flp pilus assembly protein TadD|nr:tetratricopeptide repeat protein [Spirochaetaceae bacterium]